MGKLLFVNTNRVNGIFGVVLCLAMVAVGLWTTLSGAYAGAVLIPLGIYLGKFCLKVATQRTELYEQGFISKNIFGSVRGRYADLKSIVRGAVRTNGVLQTNIHFVTNSGEKLTLSNEKFLQGDDKMELLLEHSSAAMAEVWAKNLECQMEVVWLTKGSSPLLKIRKEGVLVEGKTGAEGLIALRQFQIKPLYGLQVQILNGDQEVITVNSGAPNYFVGLVLIAMLQTKQKSMAASTSN